MGTESVGLKVITGVQTIRQLLCQPLETLTVAKKDRIIVVYESGEKCSLEQFTISVRQLAVRLDASDHSSWLLACNRSACFLKGVLALLLAGKSIILPANNKPGTLKEMSDYGSALLTDGDGSGFSGTVFGLSGDCALEINQSAHQSLLIDNIDQAELIFFTSGSSGVAKPVPKTAKQLEKEAGALEHFWGRIVAGSVALTCVSHQHMYGLMFHLIWPLLTGRLIYSRQLEYPESLLEYIDEFRHVVLVMSPAQLSRLPEDIPWHTIRDRIRGVFSSGALLMGEHAERAEQFLGHYPLEIFGSTETGAVAWRQQIPSKHDHGAWTPITGVKASLSGAQLQIHSPWLEMPQAGFVMGDNVRFINQQRFILMGRVDKIVKIEGKRVSLTEVRKRVIDCHWVKDAEILLLETGRVQLGAVIVLTAEGKSYLASQGKLAVSRTLKHYIGQYLEAVTLPRKWRYVQQMPINSQGKIVRQTLTELFC